MATSIRAPTPAAGLAVQHHDHATSLTLQPSAFRGRKLPAAARLAAGVRTQQKSTVVSALRQQCSAAVVVKESFGVAEARGSARPVMEDRSAVAVGSGGKEPSFFGVFDGHGGAAVAELLTKELWPAYKKKLQALPEDLEKATGKAFFEVDQLTLAAPKGLFGALRERGVGGSKCGSCANTAVLMRTPSGGCLLVAANVGDSRTVLASGGKAIQLSTDHKPDIDEERFRIERKNPTPKQPLVRKAGGEWRVGGLLALSRAFGDAYLKDWDDGTRDGARGGYGLTAEPSVFLREVGAEDQWLILGTDGLWDHVPNQEAVDVCLAEGSAKSPDQLAQQLLSLAVSRGSTDDVTVIVLRLPSPASS